MPETRNSKSSSGAPGAGVDKNPSNEFVTTSMLNEMLHLQESLFKTLLDSLLNNFDSRLDAVVESVADIKTRLKSKSVQELNKIANLRQSLQKIKFTPLLHIDSL